MFELCGALVLFAGAFFCLFAFPLLACACFCLLAGVFFGFFALLLEVGTFLTDLCGALLPFAGACFCLFALLEAGACFGLFAFALLAGASLCCPLPVLELLL